MKISFRTLRDEAIRAAGQCFIEIAQPTTTKRSVQIASRLISRLRVVRFKGSVGERKDSHVMYNSTITSVYAKTGCRLRWPRKWKWHLLPVTDQDCLKVRATRVRGQYRLVRQHGRQQRIDR